MRIGIDIDDTICDTWEFLIPHLSEYFKIDIDKLKNVQDAYYKACNVTLDEYCKFAKQYYPQFVMEYKPKKNVKEVIEKLKNAGHEIIFITARSTKGFDDPYKVSLEYLNNHEIYFDKLIVNVNDKSKECLEEDIDIFIDDSIDNCKEIADKGIKVLLFDASFNKNCSLFKRVLNWNQVYEEIEKVKNNG